MMGRARFAGMGVDDPLPPDPGGADAVQQWLRDLDNQISLDALNSLPIPTVLRAAPGQPAASSYLPWVAGIGAALLLVAVLKR